MPKPLKSGARTDDYEGWAQPLPIYFSRSRRKKTPWSQIWHDDPAIVPDKNELVVQKNGQIRQAGADRPDGTWTHELKQRAESSLYVFTKSILGRRYLTPLVHLPICNFLQEPRSDPWRCLLMMFRNGGKTSIVSHAMPLHIVVQSKADNIYFPGQEGSEQRIILVKETIDLAMDELRTVMGECEENELLKALWPERFWADPRRQAKLWNASKLILPRMNEWPDPTFRAIGVGAAVAGKHPSVKIGDDLISEEAMNSPSVMQSVITWLVNSRSLINKPGCIEYTIGTPWAVYDCYSYLKDNDPTVKVMEVPLIDASGTCVYPEFQVEDRDGNLQTYGFSPEKIENLRLTLGQFFLLQYQITTVDPSLTDFALEALRWYTIQGGEIVFQEDARDQLLEDLQKVRRKIVEEPDTLGPMRAIREQSRLDRRKGALRERPKVAA